MNNKIVINTGPLIAFGKMKALELLEELPYQFILPVQVQSEILAGSHKGKTVSIPPWIRVVPLRSPLSQLSLASLDAGEAAVIELALQDNISDVCIDEIKGRRAAVASGLTVIGSLGLLGKARTLNIISSIRPLIIRAQTSGVYYDSNLVESFLGRFGE